MCKWIQIESSSNGMFTDIMNLGHSFLVRTYSWCPVKNKCTSIAIVQIDRLSGIEIMKKLRDDN